MFVTSILNSSESVRWKLHLLKTVTLRFFLHFDTNPVLLLWTFIKIQFHHTSSKMTVWWPLWRLSARSVCLCSWDQYYTYFVRDVPSSLIIDLIYVMKCVFLITYLFKNSVIPICTPSFEFAATLVASRLEDAFVDLTANSILGVIVLSITVKIAFWIHSSTVSTILIISLSILSVRHFSNEWTFTVLSVLSLVIGLLISLFTVNLWSAGPLLITKFCLSLLTASPITTF